MNNDLTCDDIIENFKDSVYTQEYNKDKTTIAGVQLIPITSIISEDGDFAEITRFGENGNLLFIPEFKLMQINRSSLDGDRIKAWHLHFMQNEIWYVNPDSKLLVGLLDLRKNSPSTGKSMRIVLGDSSSQLLLIPKGVAHGSRNLTQNPAIIWYFIDRIFDPNAPDEQRLHWDANGADFWNPQRD